MVISLYHLNDILRLITKYLCFRKHLLIVLSSINHHILNSLKFCETLFNCESLRVYIQDRITSLGEVCEEALSSLKVLINELGEVGVAKVFLILNEIL